MPGVIRNTFWMLDYNANYTLDSAAAGDLNFYFGPSNCIGVVDR